MLPPLLPRARRKVETRCAPCQGAWESDDESLSCLCDLLFSSRVVPPGVVDLYLKLRSSAWTPPPPPIALLLPPPPQLPLRGVPDNQLQKTEGLMKKEREKRIGCCRTCLTPRVVREVVLIWTK